MYTLLGFILSTLIIENYWSICLRSFSPDGSGQSVVVVVLVHGVVMACGVVMICGVVMGPGVVMVHGVVVQSTLAYYLVA